MIERAAESDSILFKHTPARGRFPGIYKTNVFVFQKIDKRFNMSCNTGKALQKIKGCPFAFQKAAKSSFNLYDSVARIKEVSIRSRRPETNVSIKTCENLVCDIDAGNDKRFFGDNYTFACFVR